MALLLLEGEGDAGVGDQVVAPDAASGGAAEEADDLGDLLGTDDGAGRRAVLGLEGLPAAGVAGLGPDAGGVGGDEAGEHAVDGDVVGGELDGQVADQLLEGGLRIGYKTDRYDIAAFARNITTDESAVSGIDFNNLTAMVNEPRIFGIEAGIKF
jgi:hypothetical protein